MEANNRMLYDDIIKKTDVQYTIPVYQRTYTWEKENCNKLYDDIIASIKNNRIQGILQKIKNIISLEVSYLKKRMMVG